MPALRAWATPCHPPSDRWPEVADPFADADRAVPFRCMNPASAGIPFLGLTVPFVAESSAVVPLSVSGAVSFGCYSAGSDNRRYR
jgi:hypothetical protein